MSKKRSSKSWREQYRYQVLSGNQYRLIPTFLADNVPGEKEGESNQCLVFYFTPETLDYIIMIQAWPFDFDT